MSFSMRSLRSSSSATHHREPTVLRGTRWVNSRASTPSRPSPTRSRPAMSRPMGVRDSRLRATTRTCATSTRTPPTTSAASNYGPLPYIGFASGVTASDLDAISGDPSCGDPRWWCDFASMRDRPNPSRGFALHQHPESQLVGIQVDRDDVLQNGVVFGLVQIETDPLAPDTGDPDITPTSNLAAGD